MLCDTCVTANAHQIPFVRSNIVYFAHLELVYIDIWGCSPVEATSGVKYYIAFLNAYSKYTWLYLLHSKSQFSYVFTRFKQYDENQTNYKIKYIQTDNAKDFISLQSFLNLHGIRH